MHAPAAWRRECVLTYAGMKPVAIALVATCAFALAACGQQASTTSSASPSTSAPSTSASSTPTRSASSSPTATAKSATQVAESLPCTNISKQTPAGTVPKANTEVRCTFGDQGYLVLGCSSTSAAATAVASLRSQASSSGESMTIVSGSTWIIKAAEGPTVGVDLVTAAQKQGGKKLVLS